MSNNPLHIENADYLNKTDEEVRAYLLQHEPGLTRFSDEEIDQLVQAYKQVARDLQE